MTEIKHESSELAYQDDKIDELRVKLKDKIAEVLELRKSLDLQKEETQLFQLKYEKMKENLDSVIGNKLDAARGAIKEMEDDGNKK